MNRNLDRYVCTLWITSALFCIARYVCVAIMAQGGDNGIYRLAMERLGPFLPTMSILCLLGSLLLLVVDLVITLRNKKK